MRASSKVLAGGALIMALLPFSARAADTTCSFASKIDLLRSIQADGDRDYMEAIKAQLAVRKDILKSTVDCAAKDLKTRQERFQKLPEEARKSTVGREIERDLEASEHFYAAKRRLVDGLGIKGTQDTARDIATWRNTNYRSTAERQDAFTVWLSNQELFIKTESRFSQIRPVVLSLKLLDRKDIEKTFTEAEKEFAGAKAKNEEAKKAIEESRGDASTLIKASLEPLASIYKKFFDVSEAVKKIVP